MVESRERFALTPAEVAGAGERTKRFLLRQGFHEREAERMRRTAETLLRRIAERRERGAECELELGVRLGRAYIRIIWRGAEFDPTVTAREAEGNAWSEQLLAELGLVPQWSRRRGVNRLELWPYRRTCRAWLGFGTAVLLAALAILLAPDGAGVLETAVLQPVYDCIIALWRLISAPLVFFCALSVVCGAADTAQLGKPGKRMLRRFFGATLLWAFLGAAACALLLRLPLAPGRAAWDVRLAEALRSLVPDEARAGPAHAALFGALCGAALALLGGRVDRLRELCRQITCLLKTLAAYAGRLAPLLPLCALPHLLRAGTYRDAARLLLPCAVFCVGIWLCKLLAVSLRRGESPLVLARTLAGVSGKAFQCMSTDSVSGLTFDSCEIDLGISHELTLLGLPIGNVLCAPVTAACLSVGACVLAGRAGLPADAAHLAGISLLAAALAAVLPRAPGMLLFSYVLLLRRVQPEPFALLAAVSIPLEALCAALESAYLRLELLRQDQTYCNAPK
ncbi:MAG: cation:dicarboxylase symporter family transporter [Oscillospiraceae bacterium]|nr:cation:dicarboxylase symporter family transporter [Oscillospiraceae bacterium]